MLQVVDRSHSHMAPDVRQLDFLAERAIGRMMGGLRSLGLPSRTLLARMIEFGIRGAAQRGSSEVEDLPEDQQLFWKAFGIVCRTEILKSFFFDFYTKHVPIETHARKFGWSKDKTARRIGELRRHMVTSLKTLGMRFDG